MYSAFALREEKDTESDEGEYLDEGKDKTKYIDEGKTNEGELIVGKRSKGVRARARTGSLILAG